jgi:tRNA threonylcarbamoyladenosine modification (KEOPS) complex  Pcc1 subunit
MKSDVWFDEEAGVVRMRFVGNITNEEYTRINRELLANISPEKRRFQLVDLTASTTMKIDRKTRKEITAEIEATDVAGTKTAIVGASPMVRMMTKVILAMRKEKDAETRFFKNEDEALTWLKGEK